MEKMVDSEKNLNIEANSIDIGPSVTFGENIDIRIRGNLSIGSRCHMGNNVTIRGNNISIGDDLFHSSGLNIGGGGIYHPRANCTIGKRCTVHNNLLNVCEPIVIGDDVGLSPDVTVLTHGYWLSVLEGFPASFSPVTIHSGSIIGYRSLIMMGVIIGENAVVGAGSVVTKDIEANAIYAGNPAKLIRRISPLSRDERVDKVKKIIGFYQEIASHHNLSPEISVEYPIIRVNNATFDVETLECSGDEDDETDDFRDYVRKWGLRYYTDRPFRSVFRDAGEL